VLVSARVSEGGLTAGSLATGSLRGSPEVLATENVRERTSTREVMSGRIAFPENSGTTPARKKNRRSEQRRVTM
jgi:hypothetical protein